MNNGCLTTRNGYFYAVIKYKDKFGNWKQKRISTGLKERGNKKEAKLFLEKELEKFNELPQEIIERTPPSKITFMEYLKCFIEDKKGLISPSTYSGYLHLYKTLLGYFGNNIKLKDVTYKYILEFYEYLRTERHLKNNSIKKYKEILSPAFRFAYRDNLIYKNPYEFIPKLKREKSKRDYYDKEELEQLFEVTDKTPLILVVRVAAYYGFRRSELLGLRWQSINFMRKTITVENKVLNIKKEIICSEVLKTLSSNRTLPLIPEIEELLLKRKSEIEHNKVLYGSNYNRQYEDYVFVNDMGNLMLPDYVSHHFSDLLKKNNLKYIRFHDLRHSCASLLVANKVPMKYIQEWLGHSSYNVTADTYSHLDFESKKESAYIISKTLSNDKKQGNTAFRPMGLYPNGNSYFDQNEIYGFRIKRY